MGVSSRRMKERPEGGGFAPADAYVAAQLYYEQGMAQQEVAERMHTSRASISRMLSYAREEGIVQIVLHPPAKATALSRAAAAALSLERVVAVDVNSRRPSHEAVANAARVELAKAQLSEGDVLGTSWGEMVRRIAAASPPVPLPGVRVVPMIGSMDESDPRFQSNEIAREFATRGEGTVVFISAPVAPTDSLARALRKDAYYQERFELWNKMDAAIVGIGGRPSVAPDLPAHMEWSRAATDAVGDVACRLYSIDGKPVDLPHGPTLIGVTWDQLTATPIVVGAAVGGDKVESIVGASRAGLIKTLVTDVSTARAVLSWLDSN